MRLAAVRLATADIAGTVASLAAAGVEVIAAPERQPWGGTLATLADPDGNQIQLVQTRSGRAGPPGDQQVGSTAT